MALFEIRTSPVELDARGKQNRTFAVALRSALLALEMGQWFAVSDADYKARNSYISQEIASYNFYLNRRCRLTKAGGGHIVIREA